jgi:hypothetical protein
MPEADMLAMLERIETKIRSSRIDVRHRDALIRLREILENDLNVCQVNRLSNRPADDQEEAA